MMIEFVKDYPALIVSIIGLLISILLTVLGLYVRNINGNIGDINKSIEKHITREETIIWPNFDLKVSKLGDEMREKYEEFMDKYIKLLDRVNKIEIETTALRVEIDIIKKDKR